MKNQENDAAPLDLTKVYNKDLIDRLLPLFFRAKRAEAPQVEDPGWRAIFRDGQTKF